MLHLSCRDALGYVVLLNFLIYVTLPVQLVYSGFVIGASTLIFYFSMLLAVARRDAKFNDQVCMYECLHSEHVQCSL